MDILEKLLVSYIKTHPKCDDKFLRISDGNQRFEIGDVFAMYGESIIHGLVISIHEEAGIYEFIDLVTSPILGDFSTDIHVDSLFARSLYVTPLVFTLFSEQLPYCDKIAHLEENQLKEILEVYDKLRFYELKGVRKRFLDYESERLEVLEDMYLSKIFQEIENEENEENIIYVSPSRLLEVAKKHSGQIMQEELLVAASSYLRTDKYILVIKERKVKIIFDDSLVGKDGKIIFFDEELSYGKIPPSLEFEIPEFDSLISLPVLEKHLKIMVNETDH